MLKTTLLTLCAGLMLAAIPRAALAQLGPPPGPPLMLAGPPPGLGAGGPPAGGPPVGPGGLPPRGAVGAPPRDLAAGSPHFSRLGGAAGLHGLDRGEQANLRGVESRAVAHGANNYNRNSYTNYGNGHGYRYAPYAAGAAATAAAYAYERSDASSEDGCYYVSKYGRYGYRRALVCNED